MCEPWSASSCVSCASKALQKSPCTPRQSDAHTSTHLAAAARRDVTGPCGGSTGHAAAERSKQPRQQQQQQPSARPRNRAHDELCKHSISAAVKAASSAAAVTLQEALQLREERRALLQRLLVALQQAQAVSHHQQAACSQTTTRTENGDGASARTSMHAGTHRGCKVLHAPAAAAADALACSPPCSRVCECTTISSWSRPLLAAIWGSSGRGSRAAGMMRKPA